MTIEFLAKNLGHELNLLNKLNKPLTLFEKKRYSKQDEFVKDLELKLLEKLKEKHEGKL